MATPKRFSVDNEKRKIVKLYMSLREILEATLKQMKANTDDLSASKIDVAVKAIRQLPGILLELEKIEDEQGRKAQRAKDRQEAIAQLPAPGAGKSPQATPGLEPDPDFPEPAAEPETPIVLPFPLSGI
jgi:hypothetical protein